MQKYYELLDEVQMNRGFYLSYLHHLKQIEGNQEVFVRSHLVHTAKRLEERYGMDEMDAIAISAKIMQNEMICMRTRQERFIDRVVVMHKGKAVFAIWNSLYKCIITVLPYEKLM